MSRLYIPEDYSPILDPTETQHAGCCMKANKYVQSGEGTADEVAAMLGFRLYRTDEMADLLSWMREYNKTAADDAKLTLYGFDMQRIDEEYECLMDMAGRLGADTQTLASIWDEENGAIKESATSDDIKAVLDSVKNDAAVAGDAEVLHMIDVIGHMFVSTGAKMSRMEHFEKKYFETEYGVTGMAREKLNAFEPTYSRCLAGCMEAQDYICGALAALMFLMIATGVNIIVRVAIINGSYKSLLQEGDYSRKEKQLNKKLDGYRTAYWCTITAIFLGWSLYSRKWDITWIVWPVAAVLYVVGFAIAKTIIERKGIQ